MNLSLILFIILTISFILYIKNFFFLTISNKTEILAKIFLFLSINLFNFDDSLNRGCFIYLLCLIIITVLLLLSMYIDNKEFITTKYSKKIFFCLKFIWLIGTIMLFIYLSFKIFNTLDKGINNSFYKLETYYKLDLSCLNYLFNKLSFHSLLYDTMGALYMHNLGVDSISYVEFCNIDKPSIENTSSVAGDSVNNTTTVSEDNPNNGEYSNSNKTPKLTINTTNYFPTEYIKSINPDADIEGLKADKARREEIGYCNHLNRHKFVSGPDDVTPMCDSSVDPCTDARKELYMPDKHEAVKHPGDVATVCNDCMGVFCANCMDIDAIPEDVSDNDSDVDDD